MAYQVNTGIGAVAGVQTFILDGLAANPGGSPGGGGGGFPVSESTQWVHTPTISDEWVSPTWVSVPSVTSP